MCLTTELSMLLMQLWLMSRVVRFLHTGITAVTEQPDSAPSASHWENSLASGTRIDCRTPTHRTLISARHDNYKHVLKQNSVQTSTIIVSVQWWMLRVARLDRREAKPWICWELQSLIWNQTERQTIPWSFGSRISITVFPSVQW